MTVGKGDATRPAGRARDPIPLRRIKRKLEVLKGWRDNGIPPDKKAGMPRSLRQAFSWVDEDLGIRGTGSLGDFTTTHPTNGAAVRAIRDVIADLVAIECRTPAAAVVAFPVARAGTSVHVDAGLVAAVSQWHAERQRADDLEKRAVDAEHKRGLAEDDVARLENEVRGLRLRLAAEPPLRIAEAVGSGDAVAGGRTPTPSIEVGAGPDPKSFSKKGE